GLGPALPAKEPPLPGSPAPPLLRLRAPIARGPPPPPTMGRGVKRPAPPTIPSIPVCISSQCLSYSCHAVRTGSPFSIINQRMVSLPFWSVGCSFVCSYL